MKNTVSLAYHRLPAAMVVLLIVTVILGMKGKAALANPPVPLEPAVPPDPDAPMDMTTRNARLQAAIAAAAGGGQALTSAKKDALVFALDGLDQEAFFVQSVYRYDMTGLLTTGFVPASTNRAQSQLDTPTILGADTDITTQLALHVTPIDNAYGYEVQTCIGTGPWTTALYSSAARTILLTGLTSGSAMNIRVRALGGLTGYSDWSAPFPRYVT